MRQALRILSLEDNPKDADLIKDLLDAEGMVCDITRVENQADFLASLKQGGIDLILADYSLPSFDGISALKLAMKACPDVPFIFVSGTLGEEVAIEALKIGATDYVLKTRLSRLVPAVQRALREATQKAERKRAEEALCQSETHLAEAQRLSKTGSFGCTLSTGEMFWSEETFRIYGYDRSTQPAVERVLQRIHPEDRPLVQEQIDRACRDGTNCQVECRLLFPDDSVKHVRIVAHATKNEAGIIEFIGAVMDVTATRQAEEKLRRSEAYLTEAQKLSYTGSFGWDVSSGEIFWSQETFRIFGYDRAAKATIDMVLQRTHPEDRPAVQQLIDRVSREKTEFDFEHRLLMPDGSVKYLRVVGHPSKDERGCFEFVGAVTDITERKRAEAMRDGESRILEMIARDAPVEEILEKLVRVVEAQFPGLLCSVLLLDEDGQHVRHGAAPSLPRAYTEAINGLSIGPTAGSCGTAMYRRESVVVTDILEDPLWEPYRAVAEPYGLRACWSTPILAHSGKALGSFAMYYREPRSPSLAETHALEMATHLAGIAIERKLAREERERLRQAQADLAHINRVTTMGELAASLAHEIRQPIAAAATNAKTCLRWLGRDAPNLAEGHEAAARMVKDVTRAADIISTICALFKKGDSHREFLDVNQLIREMIVLLRNEANRYSISIHTDLADDVPKVMADRVQLQQVFMNLMLNGIEAMKGTTDRGELTIKSEASDAQLLISVSDTGVGLPPEQAEQIFRAFFTTKDNGTGMGLPISRSIIESHGGRLWFAGNCGRGATFQFTLPATLAAHA